MGKITVNGTLKADKEAVMKAKDAVEKSPMGDAPGDNSTDATANHNWYYDDRTSYRDYVKAYKKLTQDQADYFAENSSPSDDDRRDLQALYDSSGSGKLQGQDLIDALKGNQAAMDPKNFNPDKAITLAGVLYQGEDLQHRVDETGQVDLSSGPMDTNYTDYTDGSTTHQLNGHLLMQARDSKGAAIKDFKGLTNTTGGGLSARAFYLTNNEGKDPATGQVMKEFTDRSGKTVHDAPFVQTQDGKIYYPVYDAGAHYAYNAFAHATGPISDAAKKQVNDAIKNNPELQYTWVEKDTRGWAGTMMDVLGSAAAAFAMAPLDPIFNIAGRAVSIGAAVGRSVLGRAAAGASQALSTRVAQQGAASVAARELSPEALTALSNKDNLPALPAGLKNASWESTDHLPLFNGAPKAADAGQGRLGDCWLLTVLQNLASRSPDFIKNFIKVNDTPDGPTYTMNFFQKGSDKPVPVTVDGKLVFDDSGAPTFAGHLDGPNWPAIIEKGAALFFEKTGRNGKAGFDSIVSGNEDEALEALTGSTSKNWYVPRADGSFKATSGSARPGEAINSADDMWQKLDVNLNNTSSDVRSNVITASFDDGASSSTTGLLPSHAYSVVKIDTIMGQREVTLQNPHLSNPPPGIGESVSHDGLITIPFDKFFKLCHGLYL